MNWLHKEYFASKENRDKQSKEKFKRIKRIWKIEYRAGEPGSKPYRSWLTFDPGVIYCPYIALIVKNANDFEHWRFKQPFKYQVKLRRLKKEKLIAKLR